MSNVPCLSSLSAKKVLCNIVPSCFASHLKQGGCCGGSVHTQTDGPYEIHDLRSASGALQLVWDWISASSKKLLES